MENIFCSMDNFVMDQEVLMNHTTIIVPIDISCYLMFLQRLDRYRYIKNGGKQYQQ